MILANLAFFVAISAFNLYHVKIIGNYRPHDSANLVLTYNAANVDRVRVYAVNYNVLRIMSGMGGLAYSN